MYRAATGDSEGRATDWFARIMAYGKWIPEDEYDMQRFMDRHGYKVDCSSLHCVGDDIIFESEEEFLYFKLKFI